MSRLRCRTAGSRGAARAESNEWRSPSLDAPALKRAFGQVQQLGELFLRHELQCFGKVFGHSYPLFSRLSEGQLVSLSRCAGSNEVNDGFSNSPQARPSCGSP